MGVINPKNACIDIDWGASIGEMTLLAPGLSNRNIVRFRPTSMEPIHDMLTVIVDDDGATAIPIIARSASSPILESKNTSF